MLALYRAYLLREVSASVVIRDGSVASPRKFVAAYAFVFAEAYGQITLPVFRSSGVSTV